MAPNCDPKASIDSGIISLVDTNPGSADADNDGWTVDDGDCNDNDANINPGETEELGSGTDEDCNGVAQLTMPAEQKFNVGAGVNSYSGWDVGVVFTGTDGSAKYAVAHPTSDSYGGSIYLFTDSAGSGSPTLQADELDADCELTGRVSYQDTLGFDIRSWKDGTTPFTSLGWEYYNDGDEKGYVSVHRGADLGACSGATEVIDASILSVATNKGFTIAGTNAGSIFGNAVWFGDADGDTYVEALVAGADGKLCLFDHVGSGTLSALEGSAFLQSSPSFCRTAFTNPGTYAGSDIKVNNDLILVLDKDGAVSFFELPFTSTSNVLRTDTATTGWGFRCAVLTPDTSSDFVCGDTDRDELVYFNGANGNRRGYTTRGPASSLFGKHMDACVDSSGDKWLWVSGPFATEYQLGEGSEGLVWGYNLTRSGWESGVAPKDFTYSDYVLMSDGVDGKAEFGITLDCEEAKVNGALDMQVMIGHRGVGAYRYSPN